MFLLLFLKGLFGILFIVDCICLQFLRGLFGGGGRPPQPSALFVLSQPLFTRQYKNRYRDRFKEIFVLNKYYPWAQGAPRGLQGRGQGGAGAGARRRRRLPRRRQPAAGNAAGAPCLAAERGGGQLDPLPAGGGCHQAHPGPLQVGD